MIRSPPTPTLFPYTTLFRSKDGTKVPLNIIKRKGARLNGDIPTILTGYGGYGISMTPRFDFTRRVWLEHGGMFAVANLRSEEHSLNSSHSQISYAVFCLKKK